MVVEEEDGPEDGDGPEEEVGIVCRGDLKGAGTAVQSGRQSPCPQCPPWRKRESFGLSCLILFIVVFLPFK